MLSILKLIRNFSASNVIKVPLAKDWVSHNLPSSPATTSITSKEELSKLYHDMVVIRRMEMAADNLYKSKLIRGFCHLAIGQEAIPVGIEAAIEKDDSVITAYRCHGFTYTRGCSVTSILAELMGHSDGCSKGKGGSMHMFSHEFYGGNGIVGAQVPVGAGLALAQKYHKSKNITLALFGDGASNQGQVFESFNMAKLWNLPVVFICENNQYGMGTSAERSSGSTKYYTRGDYISGLLVNANDVFCVKEAIKFAKEWIHSGKGPLVMEFKTYRYQGHSMSDPGTSYRTREEVQKARAERDPISGLKKVMLDVAKFTEDDIKTIDNNAKKLVDEAVSNIKTGVTPDDRELWDHVYVEGSEPAYLRGRTEGESHFYKNR